MQKRNANVIYPNLTKRERETLDYLLLGSTNKDIGKEMGISEMTAKKYMRDIGLKLGLTDRVKLALFVHEHRKPLGVNCGFCQD